MLIQRYDEKGTRVCARTPFDLRSKCRTIHGAHWDKAWVDPLRKAEGAVALGVWHWPTTTLPAILRTFPEATTTDPLIQRLMQRASAINAARTLTRQRMATLARDGIEHVLPQNSGIRLHAHQRTALQNAMAASHGPARACFHQTGTGKTITACAWIEAMVRAEEGMQVGIVVCPVTLISAAWVPDITRWFPDLPIVVLREHDKGVDREYAIRQAVNKHGRVVAIINYEAVRTDASVRRAMSGAAVVLDESSKIKNDKASVTKHILDAAPTFRALLLLSGTPAPNSPDEYHPQMKALAAVSDYDPFPGTKTMFREEFCTPKQWGGFQFRDEKIEELYRRMRPVAEWIRKEDCTDLPAKQFISVPIELEADAAAAYIRMRDEMELSIVNKYGEKLSAHVTNALTQVMRLRQITAGFIPAFPEQWLSADDDAPMVMVPMSRAKLAWLLDFVETCGERVLVWTQFKFETKRLMEELASAKVSAEFIDGSVPIDTRAPIIDRFRANDFQVLVAHPGTMKYGVSLPGVTLSVFLSCSRSCEEYLQAQDRIHGIGRGDAKRHSTFYRLLARANGEATYDYAIQNCLDGKEALQALVFHLDAKLRNQIQGFNP